jgi:hypothetical protein
VCTLEISILAGDAVNKASTTLSAARSARSLAADGAAAPPHATPPSHLLSCLSPTAHSSMPNTSHYHTPRYTARYTSASHGRSTISDAERRARRDEAADLMAMAGVRVAAFLPLRRILPLHHPFTAPACHWPSSLKPLARSPDTTPPSRPPPLRFSDRCTRLSMTLFTQATCSLS